MPIRINLLAEAHAAEDLRRRDPVKRVIFYGALLVALTLVWSSSLQLEAMLASKSVTDQLTLVQTHTNEFQHVQSDQKELSALRDNLEALNEMTTSRFLQGNLLDALQRVTVDGVRLIRIRVDQNYVYVRGAKAQRTGSRVIGATADTVREKIVVTLDARDGSANPGDQVNKFKEAVAAEPYFKSVLNKTNGVQLVSLSPPQISVDGKPYVLFTLECHLPEITR